MKTAVSLCKTILQYLKKKTLAGENNFKRNVYNDAVIAFRVFQIIVVDKAGNSMSINHMSAMSNLSQLQSLYQQRQQ